MMPILVNGEERRSAAGGMTPLLDVLRDEFFLTGAKSVCREGFCGACTVLLDGEPVVSCLMPVGMIEGREVRTVEGLGSPDALSPVQRIMEEHDVVQCGMCFPGIVVTLTRFLEERPRAAREEIKAALVGNVCRCTGYERIVDAALALAREG